MFRLVVFLVIFFSFYSNAFAVTTQERAALIALYNATDGANWTRNNNWLDAPDTECDWYGVTCDSNSNVQKLNLSKNQLTGFIPFELGNLGQLQYLSLTSNQLSGSIPSELGNLSQLQDLNLGSNQLTGSIPPALGYLSQLQRLTLNANQLTGSIPPALGNLSQLQRLYLNINQLSGSIPSELGNLSQLQLLSLRNNQLSGSIPISMMNLTQLYSLTVRDNGCLFTDNLSLLNFIQNLDRSWIPCTDEPTAQEILEITADKYKIPADGESSTTLTISLKDKSLQPLSNAGIVLGTPEFGSLSQLSGTTNASGELQIQYTAPTAVELNGQNFVELNVQYPDALVSDSIIINFAFASVSVWADPHVLPYSNEVAIIPGDSRFPGRYQFTLRDYDGQAYTNEELIISIADSTRARLETDSQAGGKINVVTDDQGRVVVDYIYLGSPEIANIPIEDTIVVSHKALLMPFAAKVSIGLDIEITNLYTPQRDTGVFPKTLGMRIQLADGFRPDMDLRAYLSELEDVSTHNIGVDITTEWLNPPKPEFMDTFSTIFPNYGNDDPPQPYKGIGLINHADNNQTQTIVDALDSPQTSYGINTLPAIIFEDAGNYWFRIQANPIILSEGVTSYSDFVHGANRPNLGRLFAANVLEEAESVFQSVVCSVKPTNKAQFVAMTLFVNNPYFQLVPPIAAVNMITKASGIICDYMQGNYATAAINMASLGADGLTEAYTSGALDISLEQFLKLGKIVNLNQAYSKFDNINNAKDIYIQNRVDNILPFNDNWPEDLNLIEYREIINKTISGEMSAYSNLTGWQILGILNDGNVTTTREPDETEYFSHDGVHVYLLPSEDNTIHIQTSSDADIYRFYRAEVDKVFTAEYTFSASNITSLLNLSLLEAELEVDNGADGSIDNLFSPEIKMVDTTWTALELITNQKTYRAGDILTLSATLENSANPIQVDVYVSVTDSAGNIYSIPDLTPGHAPMVANLELPGNFILPEVTIFSFPVSAGLSGAGQFRIDAFLTYPGTLDVVGGYISTRVISFP